MPVFTDAVTWICMKGKQPVSTWNMLIKAQKFHRSPTQCVVWGINQTKKKREHFYISNLLPFKSSTVCGLCLVQGWQTKDCTGRDDSSDKRVVRNPLGSETHHYWEYESIRAALQPIKIWPWVSASERVTYETFCIISCGVTWNVACNPEFRWAASN